MERNYFRKHGKYTADFAELCGDEPAAINPIIETTAHTYEARIPTADNKGEIIIRHDGLVYINK